MLARTVSALSTLSAAQDWRSDFVAGARPVIDKAAAEAGRDSAEIATIHSVSGTITDTPVDVTRGVDSNGIGWLSGTVEQWIEELVAAVTDYGAGGFVYFPVAETADGRATARSRWAHEILPAVRASRW